MNLIFIPFHDWRKSEKEGFRTRDVQMIKAISSRSELNKVIVINRPTTKAEILLKGSKTVLEGETILQKKNYKLIKIDEKTYIIDYISKDIYNQIFKKHKWFIDKYSSEVFSLFINDSIKLLFKNSGFSVISQNIFAYKLILSLNTSSKIFDAWDNFLKFPSYKKYRNELTVAYKKTATHISTWLTNSIENKDFYSKEFNVKKIFILKNGLNKAFFNIQNEAPSDVINIKRPIAGYGGKISYLLNYDLINFITLKKPEMSFVFVGPIINHKTFRKIIKRKNVFFLGDKHYNEYPKYVNIFDICLVPYNVGSLQHGGDSIKAYEYLATKKKVIGTKGNGLLDLKEYVYLVDDKFQFLEELNSIKNEKKPFIQDQHTWNFRAEQLILIIKNSFSNAFEAKNKI